MRLIFEFIKREKKMLNFKRSLVCVFILLINTQVIFADVDDKSQKIFVEINEFTPKTIDILELENIDDIIFIIGVADGHANISKLMRILEEHNYSKINLEYIKQIDGDLKFAINFKI